MSGGQTPTTVYVADDHPLYREAVVRTVRAHADFDLVGEAADGQAALDGIRAATPDVAVLDVAMPGLSGLEVLQAVRDDGLPTRTVLLSAHLESEMVYGAVAHGAAAYLSKATPGPEICAAIVAVARGEVVLPPEVQTGLASEIRIRSSSQRAVLSPREHQVLACIAEGKTAPTVAQELHLSTATVKSHLAALYEKLGVNDRAAAVAEAMRRRLLD